MNTHRQDECTQTHMHTESQMRANLNSSDFYRKAPPEVRLTNLALILSWQGPESDLWPPSPGAIRAPCAALSLYCTPGSRGPACPWARHTLNPQPGGGRDDEVKRGTYSVWTQSPAHDKPAKPSRTPPLHACTHTHTPTRALIHRWGLTHIKVQWS